MKGNKMKIKWLGLISILWSCSANAVCQMAEFMQEVSTPEEQQMFYESCAVHQNDDDSQSLLAKQYAAGTGGVQKNLNRALYYYQLSAENGNAESQAQLARLYMELDRSPATRKLLASYLKTIQPMDPKELAKLQGNVQGPEMFQGELVHPYALLLLASESPDNKWFYPTKVRKAPDYVEDLLKNYPLSEEKKKKQMQVASAWKRRKLLESAFYTLSDKEYEAFKKDVYPTEGSLDIDKRKDALAKFKERYEAYEKDK